MFVTILGRMSTMNPEDYTARDYSDVPPGAYYAPYAHWADWHENSTTLELQLLEMVIAVSCVCV